MDSKLIYVKTPIGDEAVRQSTRVVQRNLRMVLVQVDGKLSVAELSEKIGNPRLVEGALRDLEDGGFIAPKQGAALTRQPQKTPTNTSDRVSAISQFSSFGVRQAEAQNAPAQDSKSSQFSTFGKPILPAAGGGARMPASPEKNDKPEPTLERAMPAVRSGSPLRWVLGLPIALVLLGLVLVLVYPYDSMKPQIEAAAGRLLQTPVSISGVGVSVLPRPALTLFGLHLGEAGEVTVEQVRIASPLALLGSGHREIALAEVVGLSIPADSLLASPLFRQPPANDAKGVAIQRLHFERMNVTARDLTLRNLSGDVSFKSDGGVEKATFQNLDLGIRLAATPVNEGLLLNIEGFGWKPLGGAFSFDSLQAKGLLQKGKLVIQSLDTSVLNGILKGSWLLDWSKNGLVMAGDATLARLDCRKVSAALAPGLKLEGDLAGSLRLRSSGKDWESLLANIEASLDVDITRGVMHGVDLGEAVRRGAGSVIRSGSTKFDRLQLALTIDSRQVSGRDLQMSAGMVSASGQFLAVRDRPLDANLVVTMQTSASTMRTPVHVSGFLPDVSAVSGK